MRLQVARASLLVMLSAALGSAAHAASDVLKIVAGDGQRVVAVNNGGTVSALIAPLQVQLTDATGRPRAGQTLTFACTLQGPNPSCTFAQGLNVNLTTAKTGVDGRATVNGLQGGRGSLLALGAGNLTVDVVVGNANQVTFRMLVTAPGAASPFPGMAPTPAPTPPPAQAQAGSKNLFRIVSGDNQSVARAGYEILGGWALFAPLVVQVTDSAGKPLSGQSVKFACVPIPQSQMVCQVNRSGPALDTMVTTDGNGMATLNVGPGPGGPWAFYGSGDMPIQVTGANLETIYKTNNLVFRLKVLDRGPEPAPVGGGRVLKVVSGDKQLVARDTLDPGYVTAYFDPLVVQLTDAAGKPLPDRTIAFTCGPGRDPRLKCIVNKFGDEKVLLTTGSDGKATLMREVQTRQHTNYSVYVASAGLRAGDSGADIRGKVPIVVTADHVNPVTFDLTLK